MELEERIAALEAGVDALSRDNAHLRVSNSSLTSRLNASLILFESRVDSVYRAIVDQSLNAAGIDLPSEEEVEHKLRALVMGGLSAETSMEDLKLKDILDGEMRPGDYNGPLTLYGFRVKRKYARELGTGIHVQPGSVGIAMFGPYKRLNPGSYVLGFEVEIETPMDDRGDIELDVYCADLDEIVARKTFTVSQAANLKKLELELDWTAAMSRGVIECRLHQRSESAFNIRAFNLRRG